MSETYVSLSLNGGKWRHLLKPTYLDGDCLMNDSRHYRHRDLLPEGSTHTACGWKFQERFELNSDFIYHALRLTNSNIADDHRKDCLLSKGFWIWIKYSWVLIKKPYRNTSYLVLYYMTCKYETKGSYSSQQCVWCLVITSYIKWFYKIHTNIAVMSCFPRFNYLSLSCNAGHDSAFCSIMQTAYWGYELLNPANRRLWLSTDLV